MHQPLPQDQSVYQDRPFASVIIPVFNDALKLRQCLQALAVQTYGQSCYEVIVVDNGSGDPEQVFAAVDEYPFAIATQELTPGSYAARNRGLALAQGEVIAFTDADCIPNPDWLETGVSILTATPNCGLVAGQIQLFFVNPEGPTMVELYESLRALPQREFVEQHHYGATANVLTTRQVIDRVGEFDSRFKSSGDAEWGQRVHACGYQLVYAEAVVVRHPTRSSWREFYGRTRRLAGGHYDLQLRKAKTAWQRQLVFLQLLVQGLTPPVFFAISVFSDARLKGVGQKLKVSWVMILVRYIGVWETLRLKLGGASCRA